MFRGALGELRNLGAEVIDPVAVDGLDEMRAAQGGGCNQFKYDLNRYLAGARRQGADALARGHHQVAPLPSVDSGAARKRRRRPTMCRARRRAAGSREEFREKLRAAVLKLMDAAAARRAGLPDVEQSAAADRRPQHAGRRQQPALLAEHRVPGDHRADGLHARRHAAGRAAVLRPAVERGDAAPPRVRVRAGDASSPSAGSRRSID